MNLLEINKESVVNYILLSITMSSAWLHNISQDDITFGITLVSGISATASFLMKTYKDWKATRKK